MPRTARSRSADGATIGGVVAAELEDQPPEAGGDDGRHGPAHPRRAGRRHDRHALVGGQRGADVGPALEHLVEPVRRADVGGGPAQQGVAGHARSAASCPTASTAPGRRRPSASAAFHDHTATGKLNAVMTAHGPIGCHVSISRWPGRSLAIVRPCSWRDRPTAKSQMSIISWTSPRPSERILPASIDTSSPSSALCSRSSSPSRRTRLPRTGAGVARHVAERVGGPIDGGVDVGRPTGGAERAAGDRGAGAEVAGRRRRRRTRRGSPRPGRPASAVVGSVRHAAPASEAEGVGDDRQRHVGLGPGDDERRGHADRALAAREHEQAAVEAGLLERVGGRRGRGGRCRSSGPCRGPGGSAAGRPAARAARRAGGRRRRRRWRPARPRRGRAWPARRRRRPGCRRTSSRACPAAQSMTSALAMMPASGSPLARPLPTHMMSGSTPSCSQAHIVPVRPTPDCTSSTTSRMPCSSHSRRRSASHPAGGHDVAALALDRLDEDRGDVARVGQLREQHLLDVRGAGQRVGVVRIGVRRVEGAGRDDAEPGPLAGLARRQRQAAERAAVERPEEGDHVRPAGVVAGELERGLDRLGAGVGEEHPGVGHRGERGQALADVGVDREVEVGRAVVQDVVDLGVDRRVDGRVGVAGGGDGDAGVEVEEAVAVDVLDHAAPGPLDDERVHAGQRRAGDGLVARDDRRGPRGRAARCCSSGATVSAVSTSVAVRSAWSVMVMVFLVLSVPDSSLTVTFVP